MLILINLAFTGGQSVKANYKAGHSNEGQYGTDANNNLVAWLLQPGGVLFSLKGSSGALNLLHFIDLQVSRQGNGGWKKVRSFGEKFR